MPKSKSEKGKWGEEIAANFLQKRGYRIIFRNWRAERGDIDIVALHENCLVFVEVKSGSTELYGPPELRITNSKKRQLFKLASIFIQQAAQYKIQNDSYRFDVVVVDGYPNRYQIRNFEHAFFM